MSARQLFIGATGICVSYLSISLLLQHVYLHKYASILPKEKAQRFNHPALTVWLGALFCAIFGFIRGKVNKQPPNPISKKEQLFLGFLYTSNIIGAQYALIYVSYLTKTIGGNFRYLLVVVIGVFFSRVKKGDALKLKPSKVVVAVIITVGVIMFTLFKDGSKKQGAAFNPQTQWIGYICILISVVADSFFTDSQAYAKVVFKPTANHLFTSANFLTFFFVFVLGVLQGEVAKQIKFCAYHPRVIVDLILAASLQVLGQVTIYYVIANFKQHMFPLLSTTRKVMTVFLSIMVYGHKINVLQWIAIFLVFGGMTYEVVYQVKQKRQKYEKLLQNKQN